MSGAELSCIALPAVHWLLPLSLRASSLLGGATEDCTAPRLSRLMASPGSAIESCRPCLVPSSLVFSAAETCAAPMLLRVTNRGAGEKDKSPPPAMSVSVSAIGAAENCTPWLLPLLPLLLLPPLLLWSLFLPALIPRKSSDGGPDAKPLAKGNAVCSAAPSPRAGTPAEALAAGAAAGDATIIVLACAPAGGHCCLLPGWGVPYGLSTRRSTCGQAAVAPPLPTLVTAGTAGTALLSSPRCDADAGDTPGCPALLVPGYDTGHACLFAPPRGVTPPLSSPLHAHPPPPCPSWLC